MKRLVIAVTMTALMTLGFALQAFSASDIALTAYSSGFALVKDTRSVVLKSGVGTIDIQDVAATVDPTSVLFKTLSGPGSVSILEQNYQFDLINPENILKKSTGVKLTFTRFDSTGKPHTDSGVLISDGSSMVVKGDDGNVTLNPQGQISLAKMPAGLRSKPTLNWLLDATKAGTYKSQLSYIANGVSWKADYVVLVNKSDTLLDLTGWVTLTNNCGTTFDNAKLMLIAGDVRRVTPAPAGRPRMTDSSSRVKITSTFEEKSFFEYHMYTMGRRTTIANNETKQLSLLSASGASVQKEMIFDGRGDWFRSWWYPGRSGDPGSGYNTKSGKVSVVLVFKNTKANHMGMPLPKGTIRVYKEDDTGSRQFIGEDAIDHTPKDENIRLHVGEAFDVVGEYKKTNYERISPNVVEESFEVTIKNHKDSPVKVKVVDHVWSDWKVVKSNSDYIKKDASTIEFPITVPANGKKVVTYTIRTKW